MGTGMGYGADEIFDGRAELFRLCGALCQRPVIGDRPRALRRDPVRWDEYDPDWVNRRGLPMVCLVRPTAYRRVLADIAHCLHNARSSRHREPRRLVRYCRVELGELEPDLVFLHTVENLEREKIAAERLAAGMAPAHRSADQVENARQADRELAERVAQEQVALTNRIRTILAAAVNGFAAERNIGGPPLRFPLFDLVNALMDDTAAARSGDEATESSAGERPPDPSSVHTRIPRSTAERLVLKWIEVANSEVTRDAPKWRTLALFGGWLARTGISAVHTGRIPVLSGPYRWFMKQPHLAPDLTGRTFMRFARRLLPGVWEGEDQRALRRLIVDAFLEDLRRAYRFPVTRVWRRRRMTYPVLLLDDNARANGGFALLELVNEIRNQLGVFDPLLVVSAGTEVPPDAGLLHAGRPDFGAGQAVSAYEAWQNTVGNDRRARRDIAWYLPIRIEDGAEAGGLEPARREWAVFAGRGYTIPDRAGVRASRTLRVLLAAVLVGSVASAVWVDLDMVHRHRVEHCGTDIASLVWTSDGQCVGLSTSSADSMHRLISPDTDPDMTRVLDTLDRQNQTAAQINGQHRNRPYLTLIDVEALTSTDDRGTGLTVERESLEGVAMAQAQSLSAEGDQQPLIRVLIANAGRRMDHGQDVARLIQSAAAADTTIVGVVGLDISVRTTGDTVQALASDGIPIVAATLTWDGFKSISPLYYQVSPNNLREAAAIESFADSLYQPGQPRSGKPRHVSVYYSADPDDKYSGNLHDDLVSQFKAHNFQVDEVKYRPSAPTDQIASEPGSPVGALAAGQQACPNGNASGGVVVYAGRGLPDFDDFIDGAKCALPDTTIIGGDDVGTFVSDNDTRVRHTGVPYYYVSFVNGSNQPRSLPKSSGPESDSRYDGFTVMSLDAAQVFVEAAKQLSGIPVRPGTIWRMIGEVKASPDLSGRSWSIEFGDDGYLPKQQTIGVVRVDSGVVDRNPPWACDVVDPVDPKALPSCTAHQAAG